jgi:SOS-response transcriptional repressor LexA
MSKVANSLVPLAIAEGISLSRQQSEILAFIVIYNRLNGFPPSYMEIAHQCGFGGSKGWVVYHLAQLSKKGLIDRIPGKPRTLHLLTPVRIQIDANTDF